MGRHLSQEEINWLRKKYSMHSNKELAAMLNRSVCSIEYYGRKLKLRKSLLLIKRLHSKGARITNEKRKLNKELNGSKKESKR